MPGAVKTFDTYGQVVLKDKLWIAFTVLRLPFVVSWRLLISPLYAHNRAKPWRRVIGDVFNRFLANSLPLNQHQYLVGNESDVETYKDVVSRKNTKQEPIVDDLGQGAKLMWLGEKRTDKVFLYLHGGGYILPSAPNHFLFINTMKKEIEKKGVQMGYAFLGYTMVPTARFPTQLKQAVIAINYLLAAGTKPENIQLGGESAGANLVAQVLSHVLHPIPSIPALTLPEGSKFGAVFLMSPWTDLTAEGVASYDENQYSDIYKPEFLRDAGRLALQGIPPSPDYDITGFMEPTKTFKGWFSGLDKICSRVLVTVGGKECMRDTAKVLYEEQLKPYHPEVRYVEQKWGIHVDPIFGYDMAFGLGEEPDKGELTAIMTDWIRDGFN